MISRILRLGLTVCVGTNREYRQWLVSIVRGFRKGVFRRERQAGFLEFYTSEEALLSGGWVHVSPTTSELHPQCPIPGCSQRANARAALDRFGGGWASALCEVHICTLLQQALKPSLTGASGPTIIRSSQRVNTVVSVTMGYSHLAQLSSAHPARTVCACKYHITMQHCHGVTLCVDERHDVALSPDGGTGSGRVG